MFRTASRSSSSCTRRRGSVLILVVAVLVLLALAGTAFVTTSMNDRYSVQQNVENTQIDLHTESVADLVKTSIVGDLFDSNGSYRQADGTGYVHLTRLGSNNEVWLASRVPEINTANNRVLWPRLSMPENLRGTEFRSPVNGATLSATLTNLLPTVFTNPVDGVDYPALQTGPTTTAVVAADADGDGIADAGYFPLTDVPRNGLTYFAAIRVIDNNSAINLNTAWSRESDFLAAFSATDSPDAGFTPNQSFFPSGVGLMEMLHDYDASNHRSAEMNALNAYRFGGATPDSPAGFGRAGLVPHDVPTPWAGAVARQDFAYRTQGEALYRGLGARLSFPGWNVDANADGATDAFERYRGITTGDWLALSYRFCLVDRSASPSTVERLMSASAYRSAPNFSTDFAAYARRRNTDGSFAEDGPTLARRWYRDNFDYGNGRMPLRALLVGSNPVSSQIPVRYVNDASKSLPNPDMLPYGDKGEWHPRRDYRLGNVAVWRGEAYTCVRVPNRAVVPGTDPATWRPYRHRGTWAAGTTYALGDVVLFSSDQTNSGTVAASERVYMSRGDGNTGLRPDQQRQAWEPFQVTTVPVKASANTAGFAELWRAYWNVMADASTGTADPGPFTSSLRDYRNVDYRGEDAEDPPGTQSDVDDGTDPDDDKNPTTPLTPAEQDQKDQPRSQGVHFSTSQMVQLRAALAAVNTIDLRDGVMPEEAADDPAYRRRHDTITSRSIVLQAHVNPDLTGMTAIQAATKANNAPLTPVEVTVYGCEPQLYVTEVYVNTATSAPGGGAANPKGYVAVELHNPYPFPISLTNWRLGLIDRRAPSDAASPDSISPASPSRMLSGYPNTPIVPISGFDGFGGPGAAPVVPPGGYLILENFNTGNGDAAVNRPVTINGATFAVPNLHEVLEDPNTGQSGGELVLLRPRRLDGELTVDDTSKPLPPGRLVPVDENNIWDLVPVDSYDFTGLKLLKGSGADYDANGDGTYGPDEWFQVSHYVRANHPASKPWQFVYPGNYDVTRDGGHGMMTTRASSYEVSETVYNNRRNPSHPSYNPIYDPNSPQYDPSLDPKNNAFAPTERYFGYERYNEPRSGAASYQNQPKLDAEGNPVRDENGDIVYELQATSTTLYVPGTQGKLWAPDQPEPAEWTYSKHEHPVDENDPRNPYRVTRLLNRPIALGAADLNTTYGYIGTSGTPPQAERVLPIQVSNVDQPGPFPPVKPSDNQDMYEPNRVNRFPFGGFARAGDLLSVPFIGSYRVRVLTATSTGYTLANGPDVVLEMNTITMDATFAKQSDVGSVSRENIGMFASTRDSGETSDTYGWARDLLEYLTVLGAADPANADVAPHEYGFASGSPTAAATLPTPQPYAYDDLARTNDDYTPPITEGLINLNTAPWYVLAQLPLVVNPETGEVNRTATEAVARRLASRDVTSPFDLIFDYDRQTYPYAAYSRAEDVPRSDPDDAAGDLSPYGDGSDGIARADVTIDKPGNTTNQAQWSWVVNPRDVEGRFVNFTRLSNLVTTRSDSFTCYIVVEGWADAYQPALARRVTQRRIAFIADRSRFTPYMPRLAVHNIPND